MLRTYTQQRALVGAGVLVLALALYVSTLAPGLTWRNNGADGGELIAAASTLGVAHPPGYPTYLLLGKGFASLVPAGDVAYRFNLFSTVAAAFSVLLFFFLVERVLASLSPGEHPRLIRLAVAGASALTMATSSVLWSQATVTEVYALNALFLTAILLLWAGRLGNPLRAGGGGADTQGSAPDPEVGKEKRGGIGRLAFGGLLLGVGMGNHVTLAFLTPVLAWLYLTSPGWNRRSSLLIVSLFLLGLAVYAYLPIRAAADSPINWGGADTLAGFQWLITAEPYRGLVFGIALEELPQRLAAWIGLLVEQFTLVGVAVGLLGAGYLWQRWPRLLRVTLALWVLYTAYAVSYDTTDSYVYLIPSFVVFTLWMAAGWLAAATAAMQRPLAGFGRGRALVGGLLLLALAIPAINIAISYSRLDLSADTVAQAYASEVFHQIEGDALLLADDDASIFTLWYQRYVQEPDSTVVVVASPLLQHQWYWDSLQRQEPQRLPSEDPGSYEGRLMSVVEENLMRGPVYLTYQDSVLESRYTLVEEGKLYRLKR